MGLFFRRTPAPVRLRPALVSDAAALADLHAGSFAHPWSVITFESMLTERGIVGHVAETTRPVGFILARAVADEAEILSVAVDPKARGTGTGRKLVELTLDALARRRTTAVFLEVEEGNAAAIAVYRNTGFQPNGSRPGYYRAADGARKDALMMRLDLKGRIVSAPIPDA